MANDSELQYVGFWARLGASLIDSVLILVVTYPLLVAVYGLGYYSSRSRSLVAGPLDVLISWVLPAAAAIAFWIYRSATPGKMAISARVVDADTGAPLSLGQSLIRYVGYFVSTIPFGLGLLWITFDSRKQGWHDKLAGSVVVRSQNRGGEPVRFKGRP